MTTNESLDHLFSPSKWVKRATEEVINLHVDFVTKASNSARKNVPCQLNVPYGLSETEKFDIYGIDLPPDAPIFIYIHGGYWQQLHKDLSGYAAESFHQQGIKVIVIGYTLCPNCSLKVIVEEIHAVYLACVEYAKKCGSRGMFVCGHSAGAHLASSLFQEFFSSLSTVDQSYLKGVACISGVYNLVPIVQTYVNDALKLTEEIATELSPLYQNFHAKKDVTFLVIIGQYESPAFHEQSNLFYQKLKDGGYITKFVEIKGVDHFNIVENLNNSSTEIFKLITDHMALI